MTSLRRPPGLPVKEEGPREWLSRPIVIFFDRGVTVRRFAVATICFRRADPPDV